MWVCSILRLYYMQVETLFVREATGGGRCWGRSPAAAVGTRGSRRGDGQSGVRARYGEARGARRLMSVEVDRGGGSPDGDRRRAHARNAARRGARAAVLLPRRRSLLSAARPPVSRAPPTRVLFYPRAAAASSPPRSGMYFCTWHLLPTIYLKM